MRSATRCAALLLALLWTNAGQAAWTVRERDANFEAFTRNRAGNAALVVGCRTGGRFVMKIVLAPASGWKPNRPAQVDLDGVGYPVSVEGGEDSMLFSDAPAGAVGLAEETLIALKSAKVLRLSGAAAQAMALNVSSFDLAGSAAAFERLAQKCGAGGVARAAAPAAAKAPARLPLTSGEYVAGGCAGALDPLRSIGIYVLNEGPDAGRQVISPLAEGISGYCSLKGGLKASANTYSAAPRCETGTRINVDLGPYRFSYTIIDSKTFISRGKTYSWCAEHR